MNPTHQPTEHIAEQSTKLLRSAKTIGIIGAGVSGQAAIALLGTLKACGEADANLKLIAVDDRAADPKLIATAKELDFRLVSTTEELAEAKPELIVISPGVAEDHPVYSLTSAPKWSEIDLAAIACLRRPVPMVGVTGTNGKSTVTQLLADIGQGLGVDAVAGGNIGVAAAYLAAAHLAAVQTGRESSLKKAQQDGNTPSSTEPLWILELSSYQLDQSEAIELKGAVITSFSEDHQERHKNILNYFRAKWEIINRISTGGFVVIHSDTIDSINALCGSANDGFGVWHKVKWREDIGYKLIMASNVDESQEPYCSLSRLNLSKFFLAKNEKTENDQVAQQLRHGSGDSPLDQNPGHMLTDEAGTALQNLDQPFCQYGHNLANAASATVFWHCYQGLDQGLDQSSAKCREQFREQQLRVSRVLSQFKGLTYRFQAICDTTKLAIINDSKATNLEATETALAGISAADIILLVGGVAGSPSYINLNHYQDKLKWVLCFGQDGDKIYNELTKIPHKSYCPNLADAIAEVIPMIEHHVQQASSARKLVVLFSPGCKSFDEFSNFMERGKAFEESITTAKGYPRWHNQRSWPP